MQEKKGLKRYLWMSVTLCAAVGFLLVFLHFEKANKVLIAEKVK